MKIHEILVNELLTQAEFRSAFLEYARERVGEASLLPVSEWPFPDEEAPVPVSVPVATGWRAMVPREVIQESDQWAPLSDPERWRPVGDSVGKQVGAFKKSRFRCDAAREVVEGPELTASQPVYVFAPAPAPPEPGTSYVRGRITDGLTEYTDVEVREFPIPSGAILWTGDGIPGIGIVGSSPARQSFNAGERHGYAGVTRPYLYAVTSEGNRSTAGEGYRILWPDEACQSGDEFGNDRCGWDRDSGLGHASADGHFGVKVHRRRIEWGSVPVSGATCDVVTVDEPINVNLANPDAYPCFQSTPPEGFAPLLAGEVSQHGDWWREFGHDGSLIYNEPVMGLIGEVAGEHSRWVFFRPIPVAPLPEADDWLAEPSSALFPTVPTHVSATPPPEPVAPSDAVRRLLWRLLEPHETVVEGDRYANPHNRTDMCVIEPEYGITAGDRIPCYPVIRPIVTERLDPTGTLYTARPGRRLLDPKETVPSERWTMYPTWATTEQGVRAGECIIEVTILEVENA